MTRSDCEYATLSVPLDRKFVWDKDDTFNGNTLVAMFPLASVTVAWMLNAPVVVGVPHTSRSPGDMKLVVTPLPVRIDMPGGRPVAVHVKGAVPPFISLIVRLQLWPIVQSSRPALNTPTP